MASLLPARVAWKALKELGKSALRKAQRAVALTQLDAGLRSTLLLAPSGPSFRLSWGQALGARGSAAAAVLGTALRAQTVGALAEFVVQQAMSTYDAAAAGYAPRGGVGAAGAAAAARRPRTPWSLFVRNTGFNFVRLFAMLALAAGGASLGTLVYPGRGTSIGALGGEIVAIVGVSIAVALMD